MPAAMSQLIEKLLREENCKTFVAECFRENARCIRVMEKLGFRPVPKSLYDRFVDAVSCLCLKWVLKYELKPEECQCSTITTHLDARPA